MVPSSIINTMRFIEWVLSDVLFIYQQSTVTVSSSFTVISGLQPSERPAFDVPLSLAYQRIGRVLHRYLIELVWLCLVVPPTNLACLIMCLS